MMLSRCLLVFALVVVCVTISSRPAFAGDDWKPVDPTHLAMAAPVVEKDADAEALFWEVRVNDEDMDTVLSHYVRIKVFTERGKESHGTVEIHYSGRTKIKDIAGRTIKPDGTILELKKDAIFDRTLAKAGGFKVKVKSFAMPGVEPGVIIEYRWREVRRSSLYMRFQVQRDIPVQLVKYSIKPYAYAQYGMRTITFNGEPIALKKEKEGFYGATLTNVPAFREEPRMPPEDEVRKWMLVFYSDDKKLDAQRFWKDFGKRLHEAFKPLTKLNDEVRQAAASAIGDATSPEQKLERLYEFCRVKIKNVSDDASGLTEDDRDKLKDNKSPGDTLKRGMGTGADVDFLFAALAAAAGFDVRMAMLPDRSDKFFDPNFPDDYFLSGFAVAVRVGEAWQFYDPASMYLPVGMLPWQQEGQSALICDSKEPVFVNTPLSPYQKSARRGTALLRLSEDGTLTGQVRVEYSGHLAAERKEYDDDDSPQQREQTLLDSVKERMSSAEVSNIRIENVTDPARPFVYSFDIKVPGYAQRTGKRLFLQPGFFQKGIRPLFRTSDRKHAIYFHYPWLEEDRVEIELPAGYTLDSADAPTPVNIANVGKYEVSVLVKAGRTLDYRRSFYFGANGNILFPSPGYPVLKQVFDMIHDRDDHTITLKQAPAPQG